MPDPDSPPADGKYSGGGLNIADAGNDVGNDGVDDDDLLSLLRRDAPGAMDRCIDRFGGLVWTIVSASLDHHAAADVFQETFVSLWRSVDGFSSDRGSAKTFVAVIARRRVADHRRQNGGVPSRGSLGSLKSLGSSGSQGSRGTVTQIGPDVAEHVPTRNEAGPERTAMAVEAAGEIGRVIGELEPPQGELLRMSFFEGLSHQQISVRTSLPLGTVKSHLRRSLTRLRQQLSGFSEVSE